MNLSPEQAQSISQKILQLMASPVKFRLLVDAKEGIDTSEIPTQYRYNDNLVEEKKDELIAEDYAVERNGELHLTDKAQHIVEPIEEICEAFIVLSQTDPFFREAHVGDRHQPPFSYLDDADHLREKDDLDLSVKNQYVERLRDSSRLRELAPFPLGLDRQTEEEIVVKGDISCEYIISKEMFSTIKDFAHYRESLLWKFSQAGHTIYVTDALPYMLSILDDSVFFVSRDEAKLNNALIVETEAIQEWAVELFEEILRRESTQQVTVEKNQNDVTVVTEDFQRP